MIKYVGFDKDGTLMDSIASYSKIWGKIFHDSYGIDEAEARNFLIQTAGVPTTVQVDTLLRRHNIILSENEAFQKANEIATLLGEKADSKPFPDVLDVLKKLKNEGYFIFVSSGQQESIIKKDLEKTGLRRYVDFVAGIKPSEPEYKKGEPHFRATAEHFGVPFETFITETVFVGDTSTDMDIANKSGILSIARVGTISREKLSAAGAKFTVADLSGLLQILKTL